MQPLCRPQPRRRHDIRPVPGKEFIDPACRLIGDPGQDVGKPSLRINTVQFGCLCRPANYAD